MKRAGAYFLLVLMLQPGFSVMAAAADRSPLVAIDVLLLPDRRMAERAKALNRNIGVISLLLDTRLSAEQREYAEAVRTSAGALLGVISDILHLQAGSEPRRPANNRFWPGRDGGERGRSPR